MPASSSPPNLDQRLVRLAAPVLEGVRKELVGVPVCVLLSDRNTRVVVRRGGEPRICALLDAANLRVGSLWNEQHAGDITVATAAIVDPRSRSVAGALALASAPADGGALLWPYARRIARDVEAQLVDDSRSSQRSLHEPSMRAHRGGRRTARFGWESLSDAQLGVAQRVAEGLTNQEVATELFVSPHTIDFHLRQIFNKLGIRSRVDLARIVTEHRGDRDFAHESAA